MANRQRAHNSITTYICTGNILFKRGAGGRPNSLLIYSIDYFISKTRGRPGQGKAGRPAGPFSPSLLPCSCRRGDSSRGVSRGRCLAWPACAGADLSGAVPVQISGGPSPAAWPRRADLSGADGGRADRLRLDMDGRRADHGPGRQLAFFLVHSATKPCFRAWLFLYPFHKSALTLNFPVDMS